MAMDGEKLYRRREEKNHVHIKNARRPKSEHIKRERLRGLLPNDAQNVAHKLCCKYSQQHDIIVVVIFVLHVINDILKQTKLY